MRFDVVVLGCLWFAAASAQEAPKGDQRTVKVSAQSETFVTPDEAEFDFTLSHQKEKLIDAKLANDDLAKAVAQVLVRLNIDPKAIKVTRLEMGPYYQGGNFQARQFAGYEVSRSFEVRLSDLTKVDPLVADLVEAAGNAISIRSVHFRVRDQRAHQVEARQLAVEYAKTKAAHLAQLNKMRLGDPHSISEDIESNWDAGGGFGGMGGAGLSAVKPPEQTPVAAVSPSRRAVFANRMQKEPVKSDEEAAVEKLEKQLLLSPGQVSLNATVTIEYELLPAE